MDTVESDVDEEANESSNLLPILLSFLLAAGLVGAGIYLLVSDDDPADTAALTAPATEPEPDPEPTATLEPEPDNEEAEPEPEPENDEPEPDTEEAEPEAEPEPEPENDEAEGPFEGPVDFAPVIAGGVDGPEESRAIVREGKIYLEGAVPTQEDADAIVALASEVLGADNVINNYVIDPDAGDPSLGNIRVDDTVLFETGSATIAPEFEPLLGQALALMTIRPEVTMTVVGHTDDRGPDDFNLELSQARAEAVVTWLVDRGVDESRFTAIGRGELEPIASNLTEQGRQLNRRIQVFLENLL